MEFTLLGRISGTGADDILYDLTVRQHLKPHQSIAEALSDAAAALGFCMTAAFRALKRQQIEPTGSIGRLHRGQLVQLSGCIHRHWRHAGAHKLTACGSSGGTQAV
jgi:hypothetical protein